MQVTRQPTPGDLSELASRAQAGGAAEVEMLLQRVRLVAHRYSRAKLASYPGGVHLADDVAQEICIAVLAALPRYRDRGKPFEAFVYGIAARKVADALRALHRHPIPTEDLPDAADDRPDARGPRGLRQPGRGGDRAARPAARQPPRDHAAAGRRRTQAEETGAALGMTAGAVRVAQHRALTKMRQRVAAAERG